MNLIQRILSWLLVWRKQVKLPIFYIWQTGADEFIGYLENQRKRSGDRVDSQLRNDREQIVAMIAVIQGTVSLAVDLQLNIAREPRVFNLIQMSWDEFFQSYREKQKQYPDLLAQHILYSFAREMKIQEDVLLDKASEFVMTGIIPS